MTWVLRTVAAVLAAVWALAFFGIVDLSILFAWNPYFSDVVPLEVSWGALVTFFLVVPLVGVALWPRSVGGAIGLAAIALVALVGGAIVSADPRPLWLALAAGVTAGALLGSATFRDGRWAAVRGGRTWFGVHWPLLVLAGLGFPLWVPYIVHAAQSVGVRQSDVSIGIDHWAVQASAGIAVVLAGCAAAVVAGWRRQFAVAATLAAVTIGISQVAYAATPTATESVLWGILCVLWGTAVALALSWRRTDAQRAAPR